MLKVANEGIDSDELRIIRRLCNDAALVYRLRPAKPAALVPAAAGAL